MIKIIIDILLVIMVSKSILDKMDELTKSIKELNETLRSNKTYDVSLISNYERFKTSPAGHILYEYK